uniref:Uncharacterized protein n=1 Tax=Yersinia enterocolitica W22703 TaxID=913028 RepID=F4MYJ9_YEREN|nr:unknown protein [Yersinia enterocolitica W22703]
MGGNEQKWRHNMCIGGLLLSQAATHQAMAADLSVQVNQFFQQQYPDKESQVKVVIKNPTKTSGHNVICRR